MRPTTFIPNKVRKRPDILKNVGSQKVTVKGSRVRTWIVVSQLLSSLAKTCRDLNGKID